MGLTIHYRGSFSQPALLPSMIAEVKEIAGIHQWPYDIFEERFPLDPFPTAHDGKIYGISFTPPGSETVWLTFLSNGRMSNPLALKYFGDSTDPKEREYVYMLFTKTQFAGIQTHQLIVHLLKYIKGKYLAAFKVSDEGNYWDTNDEEVLAQKFAEYNQAFDLMSIALQSIEKRSGESVEEYLNRVLKRIDKGRS